MPSPRSGKSAWTSVTPLVLLVLLELAVYVAALAVIAATVSRVATAQLDPTSGLSVVIILLALLVATRIFGRTILF